MESRLLSSLKSFARSASSAEDLFVARAKIAAYYARRGDANEAMSHLVEIRSQSRTTLTAPVLSLLNVAEGLVEYKSGNTGTGVDKWTRAKAIALAADYREGAAIASAWLAFAAYQEENTECMVGHIRDGLRAGLENYPQAMARISLTLGLCLQYCGESARARAHYARCHLAATSCGDEIEVSALMHDTAAMLLHQRRNAELCETADTEIRARFAARLESALSYEELVGISSLPSLSPILLAQERILGGHWSDAIELIDKNIQASMDDGYSRLTPSLLADRAFCRAMLGKLSEAEADAELSVGIVLSTRMHRDDSAVVYSRLSQVFQLTGDHTRASEYSVRAAEAWLQVNDFRSRLKEVSLQLDSEIAPKSTGES